MNTLPASAAEVINLYEWRCVGPNKGGRSIAVAGHRDRPRVYFFGATDGGRWKVSDAKLTRLAVTDGKIGGMSVGGITKLVEVLVVRRDLRAGGVLAFQGQLNVHCS